MKKLVFIGLVALGCGTTGWLTARGIGRSYFVPVNIQVSSAPLPRTAKLNSFASVVKKVAPTVVNVFSTKTIKGPDPALQPFLEDPRLREFFGTNSPTRAHKELSLGSGVIVTPDGYILTNEHVVDGAQEVRVALPGDHGKEMPARVVGRDPASDLAVLKIEAQHLPVVTFGNSDQLEVGDMVLAVGDPFALGQTVTLGIISGLKREGLGAEDYEDFIQTDAAINPGNSGGPLVDLQGRLVGINTAILSRSGGNQGIGFAIPSKPTLRVLESLIRTGKVSRGFLGASLQSLTPDLASALDLPGATDGALVSDVAPESPAGKAGLQSGDVIVRFQGRSVPNSHSLKRWVADTPPRSQVVVQIRRGGQTRTLNATLADSPPKPASPPAAMPPDLDGAAPDHPGLWGRRAR